MSASQPNLRPGFNESPNAHHWRGSNAIRTTKPPPIEIIATRLTTTTTTLSVERLKEMAMPESYVLVAGQH